jgi:hypothetical protein
MARRPDVETSRPEHHVWELLRSAATPRLVYRLAAWRPPAAMAGGRLVIRTAERGSARLSYQTPAGADRAACLRRQTWALRVPASCGASHATLEEGGCAARGDGTCEYLLTWTEEARLAPAALVGACATGALLATRPTPDAAAWLLFPAATAVVYTVARWRSARANARAAKKSDETFSALVASTHAASCRSPGLSMEQEGEMWLLAYEGTTLRLRHTRGLALLAHLVRSPGQEIHVSALDAITPSGGSGAARAAPFLAGGDAPAPGDAGEILDHQARSEYRRRLGELRAELAEELEQLEDQLRSAVGPGGRARRASADAERLRVAITHRIRNAIAQIARRDAVLGAHLAASVSTGYRCIYEPARTAGSSESGNRKA